jgi:hypothetical protein
MDKERGVLALALVVFLSGFVASLNLDFGGIISSIDPLIIVFLVAFALIYFSTSKMFKDKATGGPNKGVCTVISLGLSFFIVYYLSQTNFDLELTLGSVGVGSGMIDTIFPIIIFASILFMFWKIGSRTLLVFGVLLILIGWLDIAYNNEGAIWLGIILIALYLIIWFFTRNRNPGAGFTGGVAPSATRFARGAGLGLAYGGKGLYALGKGLGSGAAWGGKALAILARKKNQQQQITIRHIHEVQQAQQAQQHAQEEAKKHQGEQEEIKKEQAEVVKVAQATQNQDNVEAQNLSRKWQQDQKTIVLQLEHLKSSGDLVKIEGEVKNLIMFNHPDRHGKGPLTQKVATNITQILVNYLNGLRNQEAQFHQMQSQQKQPLLLEDKRLYNMFEELYKQLKSAEIELNAADKNSTQAAINVKNAAARLKEAIRKNQNVHGAQYANDRAVAEANNAARRWQEANYRLSQINAKINELRQKGI